MEEKCQQNDRKLLFRSGRLSTVSAGLAVFSCYGTTLLIGLFSLTGVSLAENPRVWAAIIVFLAGLAVIGMLLRWWRHRRIGPAATAVIGFGLIAWVMLRSYDALLEATGFAVLLAAVAWDATRYRR